LIFVSTIPPINHFPPDGEVEPCPALSLFLEAAVEEQQLQGNENTRMQLQACTWLPRGLVKLKKKRCLHCFQARLGM